MGCYGQFFHGATKVVCHDYSTNCFGYVLGTQEALSPIVFMQRLNELGYVYTNTPKPGDIVRHHLFCRQLPRHAGVLEAESIVESKFGKGPVYRHPVDYYFVGTEYGKEVRFLTKR